VMANFVVVSEGDSARDRATTAIDLDKVTHVVYRPAYDSALARLEVHLGGKCPVTLFRENIHRVVEALGLEQLITEQEEA
jgi:hypothetical protein